MRSLTILVALIALSLGAFTTPALAGGWAVTTFDELPAQFVSGQEYKLGYMIRQHGETPINVDKTEILAVAASGRTLSFPGKSDGAVGHYVATVFFPAGGTYTWRVTQGDFAPQELATVSVLAAGGTSTADKKSATDNSAADKTVPADKVAAAEKAAAADKAAAAQKAAAAEKAAAAGTASTDKTTTIAAAPASAPASQSGDPLRNALPFAAAAAAAMFVWRLVSLLRNVRRARATA